MIINNSAKSVKVSLTLGNPDDINIDHELYVRKRDMSYTTPTPKITVEYIEPVVGIITETKTNFIYNIFNPGMKLAI